MTSSGGTRAYAPPTYYPPGAVPAYCTPVCSMCGAVIGSRREHLDAHTIWHRTVASGDSAEVPND